MRVEVRVSVRVSVRVCGRYGEYIEDEFDVDGE